MRVYKILYLLVAPVFRLFYKIRITGKENIPSGAAVMCANHTSNLDPIFLCIACGINERWVFMAKAELFKIPILSGIIKAVGAISVNRGATDISTLRTAITALADGKKIMIFPEGTRIRGGKVSSGAKTGAAMIASRANAEMVPVFISAKKHLFGRVDIIFGKPVSTDIEEKGQAKYRALSDRVFCEIMSMGSKGEINAEN